MLVLTRKTNQSIMIGDEIEVSVLAVSGTRSASGSSAPRDVPVFRKEVYLSIRTSERRSAWRRSTADGGEALERLGRESARRSARAR